MNPLGVRAARAVSRALRTRRLVAWAATYVVATVAFFAVSIAGAVRRGDLRDALGHVFVKDFVAHLSGGALAGAPARLYLPEAQLAVQRAAVGDPDFANLFVSPPFVAWLYAPFARLGTGAAMLAWTLVSAACLGLALRLAAGRERASDGRPGAFTAPGSRKALFAFFALAFQPTMELFENGQDTALVALVWALGARLAIGRRDALAGLVFGLGAFKPQLFVLPLALFAFERRASALLGALASGSALVGAGFAVYGARGYGAWLTLLRSPWYVDNVRGANLWRMHSVTAMCEALAPPGARALAGAFGLALSGVLAVLAVVLASRASRTAPRRAFAALLVASLAVSPHVFAYDLALLGVAAGLSLDERWSLRRRLYVAALFVAMLIAPTRGRAFSDAPWPAAALAANGTPLLLALLLVDLVGARRSRASPFRARRLRPTSSRAPDRAT